jgi:glycosyltransferase involved in cell wall biosynthesis
MAPTCIDAAPVDPPAPGTGPRIVHLTKVPPSDSGVARHAGALDRALDRLGRRTTIGLGLDAPQTQRLAVVADVVRRLRTELRRTPADLVVIDLSGRALAELAGAALVAARPAARRPVLWLVAHDAPELVGAPLLVSVLDRRGGRRVGMALSDTVGRALERRVVGRADALLAFSELGAAALRDRYGHDVVRAVPLPTDLLGDGPKEPVVYCPAGVRAGDLAPVLRAFEAGLPDGTALRVGHLAPADRRTIEAWRDEHGLADRVTLTGFLDQAALDRTFVTAAVVVRNPGRGDRSANWAAASGPRVSALAAGCAVVSTDPRGSARCVAVAGRDLAAAPERLADELTRLVADPAAVAELGARATEHVRSTHAPDAVAGHLAAIWRDTRHRTARPARPVSPTSSVASVSSVSSVSSPASPSAADGSAAVRPLAFYLPQFHPIAENDEWWGSGFTEWTNTAKARPRFPGHYQPHVPADLGFYDLRLPETRAAQAELARAHGVAGFVYWHYWFAGRRILERPFDEVLASGEPDLPFALAWANQTWSGIWHGAADRILIEQTYPGPDDDRAHFAHLLPAFTDDRYVTVDGRPVFYMFRPEQLPDPARFVDTWQGLAQAAGLPGLYLVAEMSDLIGDGPIYPDPFAAGFDAGVHVRIPVARSELATARMRVLRKVGLPEIYDYARRPVDRPPSSPDRPVFPCVYPNWDNTPRSGRRGLVVRGSTPARFERHVDDAVASLQALPPERRLLFVKSWNEWAEGNHLEPDRRDGHGYLEALARATGAR